MPYRTKTEREVLWRGIVEGKLKLREVARQLHISPQAVTNNVTRWKRRQAKGAKQVFPPKPLSNPHELLEKFTVPAQPAAAPQGSAGKSLDDLLRGPDGSAPTLTLDDSGNVKDDKPEETAPPSTQGAPAAPAGEVDKRAAKTGKRVIMKVRAGLLRSALRFYGVDPFDPEIQDLLPVDMREETRGSQQSFLEMILDENEETTQKVGKIFRGVFGMIVGGVFETFDMAGVARACAVKKGLAMPEEQRPPENPPPPPKPPPDAPPPKPPTPGFDFGATLRAAVDGGK